MRAGRINNLIRKVWSDQYGFPDSDTVKRMAIFADFLAATKDVPYRVYVDNPSGDIKVCFGDGQNQCDVSYTAEGYIRIHGSLRLHVDHLGGRPDGDAPIQESSVKDNRDMFHVKEPRDVFHPIQGFPGTLRWWIDSNGVKLLQMRRSNNNGIYEWFTIPAEIEGPAEQTELLD